MAFIKSLFVLLFCLYQTQSLANEVIITKKNIAAINKQRVFIKSKKIKKKIWQPITLPSPYYTPEFYNPNELKNIFVTYKKISDKVERPLEYKSFDTSKSTELNFITHVDSNINLTDFKISLELEAKFL
ncbi:hypothetical protein [Fluviispira sanaruensis]|uniref:Uncharacterized protein n=1 Tax=Fluviispira sanaruensis TaxID=2493639 RepID=A0A4P2VV46_FLUSA|nr:hypothetical protein [Fluviispira sanaruensis]BBH52772.1 hypothetical protein JCM31447_12150 [Fluviispira sanaruensis]